MSNIKRFHPGIYIKDSLEAMQMTSKEFSLRTGISERTLSAIINGKGDITFDVAYKLSVYFDSSIDYWTNLQNLYNLFLKENQNKEELETDWNLIKGLKNYLIDNKYIKEEDDNDTIVYKVRKLVGVNNLSLLNNKDAFVCLKEQHKSNNSDYFLQNFWIALALNEARKKESIKYNKKALTESLKEIRTMTVLDPKYFYPRLKEIFSSSGVSFVFLPYLTNSNIYGVTKWFSKNNVMIAVSNRSNKADLFWFTLCHEICHVLLEHRREVLINSKDNIDTIADDMASDMLIPRDKWNSFISNNSFTVDSITDFAAKQGVLPSIVLGRLHRELEEQVPYGKYDKIFNVSYQFNIDQL